MTRDSSARRRQRCEPHGFDGDRRRAIAPRLKPPRARLLPVLIAAAAVTLAFAASARAGAPVQKQPTLTLDDAGRALVHLADAEPGDLDTACVTVTYDGRVPARIRLHGSTTGTGLDRFLQVTITRGRLPQNSSPSCEGFEPDETDHIGAGPGVIYQGTLDRFPDDPASAHIDPTPSSPAAWTDGEAHAYRVAVLLADQNTAQGLNATQAFAWSAEAAPLHPSGQGFAEDSGGGLLEDVKRLLEALAHVATEVGKRAVLPFVLIFVLVGFLIVQDRIDRRDPKLALAPIYPDPDLPFLPPSAQGTA